MCRAVVSAEFLVCVKVIKFSHTCGKCVCKTFAADGFCMVSLPAFFKHVFADFQTSLTCISKKPCLHCKEALFEKQRSLTCNANKASF